MRPRAARRGPIAIFAWPAAITLATAAGLAMGLLGDGAWDVAAWIGLAAPLAACRHLLAGAGRYPSRSSLGSRPVIRR